MKDRLVWLLIAALVMLSAAFFSNALHPPIDRGAQSVTLPAPGIRLPSGEFVPSKDRQRTRPEP